MTLAVDQVFAGYTVVRQLGSGGMGEVYMVRHPRLPRRDALKVLPASLSADAGFRARLEREADLAATLWHPHIVGVHDRGEFEGSLWITMDFVDGTDAGRLLTARHPQGMPRDEVVELVTAVADALDYAHGRRLLHRDVKPGNILLSDGARRRILLTDFGIARHSDDVNGLTATNVTVGSVAYTAPEQLMGGELDGRADQYGLAATAYHLLTGAPPFPQTNAAVVISRHLSAPPPDLADVRPELAALGAVLAKALAKEPGDRYRTCQEFAAALRVAAAQAASSSIADEVTSAKAPPVFMPELPVPPSPTTVIPRPAGKRTDRRTDAEFWSDVGVDPVKVVLDRRTLYTLRCYVDDEAYFLGRNRMVLSFDSRSALLDFVGAGGDHDLVELATFGEIVDAARTGSRSLVVTSANTYFIAGLRHGIELSADAIDAGRLELAVELALDVADYTRDTLLARMLADGEPIHRMAAAVVTGEPRLTDDVRFMAAGQWRILEQRLDEHL